MQQEKFREIIQRVFSKCQTLQGWKEMKANFNIFSKPYTSLKQRRDIGRGPCLKVLLISMQTNGFSIWSLFSPGLLRDTGHPQLPLTLSKTKASGLLAVALTKQPYFTCDLHTYIPTQSYRSLMRSITYLKLYVSTIMMYNHKLTIKTQIFFLLLVW